VVKPSVASNRVKRPDVESTAAPASMRPKPALCCADADAIRADLVLDARRECHTTKMQAMEVFSIPGIPEGWWRQKAELPPKLRENQTPTSFLTPVSRWNHRPITETKLHSNLGLFLFKRRLRHSVPFSRLSRLTRSRGGKQA
jgi:hypothetical protein